MVSVNIEAHKEQTALASAGLVPKWQNGRTYISMGFVPTPRSANLVLVSTSNWLMIGNFGTVPMIVKELTKNVNVEFPGALLRPYYHFMTESEEKTEDF
jgi:hypothetical protein